MTTSWTGLGSVVVLALLAGCGGKALTAGGGTGGAGATFDAGTAGEAMGLEIVEVLAPTTPANGTCSYTADPNQASLTSGTADVAYGSLTTYTPVVLVENLDASSSQAEQAETNRAIPTRATTKVTDLAGGTVVSLLQSMCSGAATGAHDEAACATGQQLGHALAVPTDPFSTVEGAPSNADASIGDGEPGTGTSVESEGAYQTLSLTLLDADTIALLRAYFMNAVALNGASAFQTKIQLLTYTVLQGSTLGGPQVTSNEFAFPVTVTFGSLVSNLKPDPLAAAGVCLDTSNVPTTAQTCVDGQDAPAAAASLMDPAVPDCPVADGGAPTPVGNDAG
jgi:hypothetical protein